MAYSWQCPFCGRHTTILPSNHYAEILKFGDRLANNKRGKDLGLQLIAVSCPSRECGQVALTAFVGNCEWRLNAAGGHDLRMLPPPKETWRLWPESTAKQQPNYIPAHLTKAYIHACRIAELSPDASATLSRKCLQGIIRDFWGVTKRTLNQEIDAIKDQLQPEVWEAIDGVRRTGNVGAHFDADPDMIVDVDEGEAKLLIGLIETLFEEWYVARKKRTDAFGALSKLHLKPGAGK